jgi:hypothetical protein
MALHQRTWPGAASVGVVAALSVLGMGSAGARAQPQSAPACRPAAPIVRLPELPEASGLAAGTAASTRLWAHNDSGEPELFAIEQDGRVAGRVSLSGARLEDWEALASAPCGNQRCLYVGDIGDNSADRAEVVIYRVPEPSAPEGTTAVTGVFRASYPDGPQDAETLLATPDGRLFIVTKGSTGGIALYRFPDATPDDQKVMRLERVSALGGDEVDTEAQVTDGAVSPDGRWVVLRTSRQLTFYRATEFFGGGWTAAQRIDLEAVGEPQGEAVTFGPADAVYLAGEGGGGSRPGTLALLSCVR